MGRKITRPQKISKEENKPLRYVMYVRKSSEGKDAQAQSIPDQIRFCEEYAAREGVQLVGQPIEESASAWKAHNRPKFTQLLKDIENEKYDGILSWHPDRLSRNMLESGIVMDMLDSGIIKDLRFATVQFTNDASGKLLLNILFAMAKNYTDGQSENVQRGVQTSFELGKSSAYKWGYIRDEITGNYIPHPENFEHIKQGWKMILDGKTQKEAVEYWAENDVHRITKITRRNKHPKRINISKQMASNIFSDPFSYGVLIQKEQEVDLTKISNFKPMITEEEYNKAQELINRKNRVLNIKNSKTFYPFRGMVLCSVCNGPIPMRPGKNQSSNGTYGLSYRCDNEGCTRKPKSVRAKYFLFPLYDALDTLKFTEKEYDEYNKTIDGYTDQKIEEIKIKKRSLEGQKKHIDHTITTKSRQLGELPNDTPTIVRETLLNDLEQLQNKSSDLQGKINKAQSKIKDPAKIRLSKEEFLNLANTVADKMRNGSPIEKDILARKLLLNLTLDNERAPSYHWKEPFATLIKNRSVNSGAHEKT